MSEVELLEWALCEEHRLLSTAEYVERTGWVQVIERKAHTSYDNLVLRSVLAPDEAEAAIAGTIEAYDRLGVDFLWWVTPSSRPNDLADRLERHGMHLVDEVIGMVAEPERLHLTDTPGVSARPVRPTDRPALLAMRMFEAGVHPDDWGAAEPGMRAWFATQRHRLHYVGFAGAQPAGHAELLLYDRCAHFGGAYVLPAFRGRGIYRALVAARLEEVRARKLPVVTNHCVATTSAPICRKLGFRDVCAMRVFSSATRECSRRS